MKKEISKANNFSRLKDRQGITLIALVITIIILLILAGITISQLSNVGLFGKAQQSTDEYKLAQYIEQINMDIMEEQMEWASSSSKVRDVKTSSRADTESEGEKVFITSLSNRIENNHDWLSNIEIYFEDENENEDNSKTANECNRIRIQSNDDFEIVINVNNEKKTAEIDENHSMKMGARPEIKYTLSSEELNQDKVTLYVNATILEGTITSIIGPDGNIEYSDVMTFEATKNGKYEFEARSSTGTKNKISVIINNVKISKPTITLIENGGYLKLTQNGLVNRNIKS